MILQEALEILKWHAKNGTQSSDIRSAASCAVDHQFMEALKVVHGPKSDYNEDMHREKESQEIAEFLLFTDEAFKAATRWNHMDPRVMVRDLASAIYNKEYKHPTVVEKIAAKKAENLRRFRELNASNERPGGTRSGDSPQSSGRCRDC